MESHLLQMRGLKHLSSVSNRFDKRSHLLQMRGLKHQKMIAQRQHGESHLLQMRGLKPKSTQRNLKERRRIFYRCVD